ncbi:MAG: two-component system response regulator [Cellvibrionales bacterium]|nr:two-component system response regulator [Cellvibrionales bacterium]HCH19934.1 two-component system response regulator [Cellvibrionales bacterium]|tara:strand:+ start:240 stop:623 length:384 start_codon:yes stop_codon:yes gene_type:complete
MTRLLLVEDNEMNRDMLTRRLTRKGFEIDAAGDGEQALVMIQESMPDLVLMDMNLPVKNGWTTCQEIRANPITEKLPVIALTAHAMAEDKQKALDAGCDDYTTKPIDFPLLLEKIDTLLTLNKKQGS